MGKYDNIYLYSDLDGTLLDDRKEVPGANVDALRYFLAQGGHFGMATGRSPHNMNMGLDLSLVNAPCILCNGAVIYDLGRGEYLRCEYVPKAEAMALIGRIIELRPSATVQVCTRERLHQANLASYRWEDPLVALERIPVAQRRMEDIPGDWIKIVVPAPAEQLDTLLEELGGAEVERLFSVTRSGAIYLEFLPPGACKGKALQKLRALLPPGAKLLAIGDYYNDLEMLRAADLSAAPANAPEDIREAADYRVCCNNDGAIGEFLSRAL